MQLFTFSATGDVSEWVLSSHIDDIQTMNCHVHYVTPPELYSFSYKVTWPRFLLETQAREVQVIPEDGESSATQQHEYLSVSHDTVLNLAAGEVILQGRKAAHHSMYAFTVHSLKQEVDFTGTDPRHNIQLDRRTGARSLTFQTSAPFAINRLVHALEQPDHHCDTDVGDVYERQPLYRPGSINVDVDVHDEVSGRLFDVMPWIKPSVTFNLTGENNYHSPNVYKSYFAK